MLVICDGYDIDELRYLTEDGWKYKPSTKYPDYEGKWKFGEFIKESTIVTIVPNECVRSKL